MATMAMAFAILCFRCHGFQKRFSDAFRAASSDSMLSIAKSPAMRHARSLPGGVLQSLETQLLLFTKLHSTSFNQRIVAFPMAFVIFRVIGQALFR
jgi:hypothetical protein